MRQFLAGLLLIMLSVTAAGAARHSGDHPRNPEVAREFERQNPCPSTGKPSGPCPGYVRDHVVPLACGGADEVANMQWQTEADAKAKDRWERQCTGRPASPVTSQPAPNPPSRGAAILYPGQRAVSIRSSYREIPIGAVTVIHGNRSESRPPGR